MRKELKRLGRSILRRNYWAAVAICFLLAFIGAEYADSAMLVHRNDEAVSSYTMMTDEEGGLLRLVPEGEQETPLNQLLAELTNRFLSSHNWLLRLALGGLLALSSCAVLLFRFFVAHPVQVGARCFFLGAYEGTASLLEVTTVFHHGRYFQSVWAMLCRWLFTYLWTLLLIVPGIVKRYEYYLVPYLLADRPGLSRREVFAQSRALMRGNKWRVFVLECSFLPWMLLSLLTLGVVGIFYVNPYRAATGAVLYRTLAGDRGGAD